MRAKIDALGLSIRKAAEEMGMSHTTLSRYMNHKIKRHNKDNDKKMLAFLKAH
jgi:transcriptional regulator with XRE-family HTH domain